MCVVQEEPNSKSPIHFSAVIAKKRKLTSSYKHTLNPEFHLESSGNENDEAGLRNIADLSQLAMEMDF